MVKKATYALSGVFLCLMAISFYFLMSNLTSEESHFFRDIRENHKQNRFKIPLEESTQFKWEAVL